MELLDRVGVANQADKYPGSSPAPAAARRDRASLAMNPKVMLFDEPPAHWTPRCISEVLNVMTGLAADG